MQNDRLNRQVAPPVVWSDSMRFPAFAEETLQNGIQFYSLAEGDIPALKVQFFFPGGTVSQPKKLVASAAMAMLSYGTESLDYETFATKIDSLGARITPSTSTRFTRLSMTCVADKLYEAWELLEDCMLHPRCDEENFRTWVAKQRAQAEIRMQESNYLAVRGLQETLMPGHALGTYANLEDYDRLSIEDVRDYLHTYLRAEGTKAIVSGGFSKEMLAWVKGKVAQLQWGKSNAQPEEARPVDYDYSPEKLKLTEAPIGIQVSVEMGRLIPQLDVEELLELRIAVMLLGGFFGSRLIKNIREEKGYTYGIHSYLMPLPDGYELCISSEIGNQYVEDAVLEIHRELVRMQTTPVQEEELEVVRNYLMGMMLRSFDGVFPSARQLRTLVLQPELPKDYYYQYIKKIRSITPESLQRISQSWLVPSAFSLSAAGAMGDIQTLRWPVSTIE